MMDHAMKPLLRMAVLLAVSMSAMAGDEEQLRIMGDLREYMVQTPSGPLVITRRPTGCASSRGFIQPLVPQAGVSPATEIDVLAALNDPATMVIDMRDEEAPLDATIPNSYHIPYNEVEDRMDEMGCTRLGKTQWDCSHAPKVIAFCLGPMCLQSPSGIASMVRAGFPVNKISYYRGGMMDWEALGLTTVTGNRPTTR